MPYVLVHFRPSDPTCQSFDHYIYYEDGNTIEDVEASAEVYLLDTIRGNITSGDFRKRFCKPLDYSIVIGPLLGP